MNASRTYEVTVSAQYRYSTQPDRLWIEARTAAEAIKIVRRRARLEMWFDRRNDGRVAYSARRA